MSAWSGIERAALIAAVAAISGCAQAPKPLYSWETFPRQQYETLLREGVSPESQILAMEAHAEKARGNGSALPPGFRAHLGMLYLAVGNAQAARQMWQAEMTAFPEAAPYMNRLLDRLDGSPKKTSKENPA